MAGDNTDSEHIDRLIRELTTEPRRPTKGAAASPAVSEPPASPERRPVHTWSTGRLPMPSMPATSAGSKAAAFGSAISLPQLPQLPALPDLTRVFRLPGPVALVRMWVGLAIAHSVSMTAWPYPKTYFWGLTVYLLSLSLAVVAGVWGARLSWDARLGAAHTVALVAVVWAVALAAAETIPLL